ncbi:MAG TPA: sigma-70 family RNA polymerase sigma factor [Gaiellales bacterium]
MQRPTSFDELQQMSDAELVAHARGCHALGEAGVETAKRCVALVYERNRALVRAIVASKTPNDMVDDLESTVYVRFVRVVYTRQKPIKRPAGLLVVMAQRVIATHYKTRKPAGAPLDDLDGAGANDDGYDAVVVEQLLSVLDERQREIVWGRLWGGLKGDEMAERLDISRGNVDVIFFRAMDRMRKELER